MFQSIQLFKPSGLPLPVLWTDKKFYVHNDLYCPPAFLLYTCRHCLCYDPLSLYLRVAELQVLLEEGLLSDSMVNPFHILLIINRFHWVSKNIFFFLRRL